ncbi:MAG: sensor histidine kinase [Magnetospiraceae bacterium]
MPVLLAAIGLLTSLLAGRDLAAHYAPQIDAAMEIKLNATTAHLWFEEILSGDSEEDIEVVWRLFADSAWYANSMLRGGENPEGRFYPLNNADLRDRVADSLAIYETLQTIARARWAERQKSQAGSEIDQEFDVIFDRYIAAADAVETALQQALAARLQFFTRLQVSILILILVVGPIAIWMIARNAAKLREERKFTETLFESVPGILVVLSPDGRILRWNQALETVTERSDSTLARLKLRDIVPHYQRDDILEEMQTALAMGEAFAEIDIQSAAGGEASHAFRLRSIQMGEETQVVGMGVDISQIKQAELELELAKQDAIEANKAKSDFLANMSHELRTPLNAVIGFSEAMNNRIFGPLPETYEEYAALIARSGRHLLETINQILDLAKIEAGKMEIEEEPVHVEVIAREVLDLLRVAAEEKRITLTDRMADTPAIQGDPVRIKQALFNIVGNAVKFMGSGEVCLETHQSNRWIALTVADEGPGMSGEELDTALLPFGQAKGQAYVRRNQGTGLGLSLTMMIMELHGGTMEINSQPGKGTKVRLLFPLGDPGD